MVEGESGMLAIGPPQQRPQYERAAGHDRSTRSMGADPVLYAVGLPGNDSHPAASSCIATGPAAAR
jgi:hypothetical protein